LASGIDGFTAIWVEI